MGIEDPNYELLFIAWRDSEGITHRWQSRDEHTPSDGCLAFSIGWLICETEHAIEIAPHVSGRRGDPKVPEQWCGNMVIPRVCIVHRQRVFLDNERERAGSDTEDTP